MTRFNILLTLTLAGLFLFFTQPADHTLGELKQKLTRYTKDRIADKVYLHTDKNVFLPGDTLWFKAWCSNPNSNILQDQSRILSVTIIDDEQETLVSEEYPLEQGGAKGRIIIPETADFGKYRLLGYTDLMKQKDYREVFHQPLRIYENIPRIFMQSFLTDSVYHAGETAKARVFVYNDQKQPLKKVPFSYRLTAGKKTLVEGSDSTNKKGFKMVRFDLPDQLPEEPVILTASTGFRGYDARYQTVIPARNLKVDLQFFPESGNLLKGKENRVAFKATDQFGSPFDFRGQLMDANGQAIKEIGTYYRGMGSFRVDLNKHPNPKVKITRPVELSSPYELPGPVQQGYTIAVRNKRQDSLHLVVRCTPDLSGKEATLLAQMGGTIHQERTFSARDGKKIGLSLKDMPMGTLKLTLLDHNRMPRAERLTFVNKHKRLFLDISTDKQKYHPKDRVEVTIEVTNRAGEPTPANLSLSVVDKARIKNVSALPDLLAYNYLNSEIKGKIGNCNIYFREDPRADTAMEHLMMTHGWRRYQWEEVMNTPTGGKETDTRPFFTGRVLRTNGKPAKKATVEIFRPKFQIKENLLLKTVQSENSAVQLTNPSYFDYVKKVTGREGYFHLSAEEYARVMDTEKVYIMGERKNGKRDIRFVFPHPYAQELAKHMGEQSPPTQKDGLFAHAPAPLFPVKQEQSMEKDYYFQFDENAVMLEQVVVSARRPVEIPDEVRKERYQVLEKSAEDIEKQTGGAPRDFLALLRTVTSGFTVNDNQILFRGYNSIIPGRQSGALIMLDGVNMGKNYNNVSFLNPENIKKIKVIKNAGSALKYTSQGRGGVIVIETKSGNWKKKKRSSPEEEGDPVTRLEGYAVYKEFYSPRYPTREEKLNSVDLRSTLYWNPDIEVGESGRTTITFYNSDNKMEAVCRVQGKHGSLSGSSRTAFVVY
jgi:hypothetical protein